LTRDDSKAQKNGQRFSCSECCPFVRRCQGRASYPNVMSGSFLALRLMTIAVACAGWRVLLTLLMMEPSVAGLGGGVKWGDAFA